MSWHSPNVDRIAFITEASNCERPASPWCSSFVSPAAPPWRLRAPVRVGPSLPPPAPPPVHPLAAARLPGCPLLRPPLRAAPPGRSACPAGQRLDPPRHARESAATAHMAEHATVQAVDFQARSAPQEEECRSSRCNAVHVTCPRVARTTPFVLWAPSGAAAAAACSFCALATCPQANQAGIKQGGS